MLFTINEQVYLNGYIMTNRFPYGNIGFNELNKIYATNLKGIIYRIETPSFINGGIYLYTVKIFDNLYGIEINENKISRYPKNISTSLPVRQPIMSNPLNPVLRVSSSNPLNPLNPLRTIDQYNQLNFINNTIQAQNNINNLNLNTNRDVQKTLSKYYYYKLVDEWLYKKLFPLLAFVEIVNGKSQLIKSMDKYSVEKIATASDEDIKIRVKYLEKNIITKKLVRKILKKMINRMCLNWYDLNKHEETIKKVFLEYFKDLLEEVIK